MRDATEAVETPRATARFPRSRAFGLLALIWISCARVERPNIIFIMADDLGWGDLGVYGGELGATPRLDRMAAEGMRFTNVYAGGSMCGPSRCVLMTGLHGGHCRLRDNISSLPRRSRARRLVPLLAEDVTVAALLQAEGYATAGVGKWGLGELGTTGAPWRQGFDTFFGYLDQLCAHDHYPESLIRDRDRIEIPQNAGGAEAVYAPDLFARRPAESAREALRSHDRAHGRRRGPTPGPARRARVEQAHGRVLHE
jgi:arylsulfatase A-like enzyme